MEPTITLNGKSTTLSEARVILGVPKDACFGCYLGDDGPEMHDKCYLGQAYAETESVTVQILRAIDSGRAYPAEIELALEDQGLLVQTDAPYAKLTDKGREMISR